MNQLRAIGVGAMCILVATGCATTISTVHIAAASEGRGIARARGRECIVVAPKHIVGARPDSMELVGSYGYRSHGRELNPLPGEDLVLIRASDPPTGFCADWPSPPDTMLLRRAKQVEVRVRYPDGEERTIKARRRPPKGDEPPGDIYLETADATDHFVSGMSGSAVTVNDIVVGILDSIAFPSGSAKVLGMNRIQMATKDIFPQRRGIVLLPPRSIALYGFGWGRDAPAFPLSFRAQVSVPLLGPVALQAFGTMLAGTRRTATFGGLGFQTTFGSAQFAVAPFVDLGIGIDAVRLDVGGYAIQNAPQQADTTHVPFWRAAKRQAWFGGVGIAVDAAVWRRNSVSFVVGTWSRSGDRDLDVPKRIWRAGLGLRAVR